LKIKETFNRYDKISTCEDEANAFAAELIAPYKLIRAELDNSRITFSKIISLANKYDNSITSTSIKCIENSLTENEILICYNNKQFSWFTTLNRGFNWRFIPRTVPNGSLADHHFSNEKITTHEQDSRGIWEMIDSSVVEQICPTVNGNLLVLLTPTN
jgi:hypothetical protein